MGIGTSESLLDLPAPAADHRLAYGPGPQQFGDLRLPPGPAPHPVAIALHGGFWRARYDLEHLGPGGQGLGLDALRKGEMPS